MKKFTIGISSLIAILVVIIAVAMIPWKNINHQKPIQVVTGMDFYGEVAQQVAGNHGKVTSFISNPSVDPHDYQPGTKVVLDEKMEDPYREMPAGLTGIVDSVDDLGQIHCHWENGSSLALIPGVDHFHQDMTQEPVIESSEEQEPDLEL